MKKGGCGCRVVATLSLVSWLEGCGLWTVEREAIRTTTNDGEKKITTTARDGGRSDATRKSVPFQA
jgi:hypothetical protein